MCSTMEIVNSLPPNYTEILAVFPSAANHGVIFTYGDTIFNPSGGSISPELFAHEGLHSGRQGSDVDRWWAKYLVDTEFRLEEELLGHRAEYRAFIARHKDREQVNQYLQAVAQRLSSPLYGNIITMNKARKEIMK